MADDNSADRFSSWGPLELKISLGEAVNALAIVGTGFWVSRIIERRQANQRAIKELMTVLCRDCMEHLSSLSQLLESECQPGQQIDALARNKVTRCLTRFSNAIHSIEVTSKKAGLDYVRDALDELKGHRESLRTQITDPLALGPGIDAAGIRQIEGTITQTRESLIGLELGIKQK